MLSNKMIKNSSLTKEPSITWAKCWHKSLCTRLQSNCADCDSYFKTEHQTKQQQQFLNLFVTRSLTSGIKFRRLSHFDILRELVRKLLKPVRMECWTMMLKIPKNWRRPSNLKTTKKWRFLHPTKTKVAEEQRTWLKNVLYNQKFNRFTFKKK